MPPLMPLPAGDEQNGNNPHSYEQTLKVRPAERKDLVECHITQEAQRQKDFYDGATKSRSFTVGDAVWLQVPTADKLEARWEGKWTVLSMVNVTIKTSRLQGLVWCMLIDSNNALYEERSKHLVNHRVEYH